MIFIKSKIKLPENLPGHIAMIMDGNGRWAKRRGLPRTAGHKAGFDVFARTVDFCSSIGIKYLTFYALSTENWNRSNEEVQGLLKLMNDAVSKYVPELMERNVKLRVIGELSNFDENSRKGLEKSIKTLEKNTGMLLTVALSYGGRSEIVNAVNKIITDKKSNITEAEIADYLYTAGTPDPDFIIRTSGETRISNFLLWQSAYSEYYFTKTLWPDFDKKALTEALNEYSKRKRRYGR